MFKVSATQLKATAAALFLVASAGIATFPAHADSGSSFNPGDGRVNAETADRVMVYQTDTGINVWGLDPNNDGQPLTSFTNAELGSGKTVSHKTPEGTVTLVMDAPSTSHYGYLTYADTAESLIIDSTAQYHIVWSGGWGADGSAPFVKTFYGYYGK